MGGGNKLCMLYDIPNIRSLQGFKNIETVAFFASTFSKHTHLNLFFHYSDRNGMLQLLCWVTIADLPWHRWTMTPVHRDTFIRYTMPDCSTWIIILIQGKLVKRIQTYFIIYLTERTFMFEIPPLSEFQIQSKPP